MRALIVVESLWGNTERVGQAIAKQLATAMAVDLVSSDSAPENVTGYDLVVVGGPTHGFSMSRATTREAARERESENVPRLPERGIREWLEALQPVSRPIPVAAFDTRVDAPRLPGSAAKAARHELRALGFDATLKAKSFYVHGYEGPLVDGELDRAASWAKTLIAEPALR